MPDVRAGTGVEHVVLPAARCYGKWRGTGHGVHLVGSHAGRVDHHVCSELGFVGCDLPRGAACAAREPADPLAKAELDAVCGGALGQRAGELEGVHDACGGGPECGDGGVGYVGLHVQKLFSPNDAQVGDTVCESALQKGVEVRQGLLVGADHQGAYCAEVHVKLLAEVRHERSALDVEAGHERAGPGVKAGVDDGGVGAGRAAADVVFRLDDACPHVKSRELAGYCAARDARPDDGDVVVGLLHGNLLSGGGTLGDCLPRACPGLLRLRRAV